MSSAPRDSTSLESSPLLDNLNLQFRSDRGQPTKRWTEREKWLLAAGIAIFILAGSFIGLHESATPIIVPQSVRYWPLKAPNEAHVEYTCLTASCVKVAASILDSLDTTIDPCDDFYQFANGGWIASHDIPADRGVYSAFFATNDNNKRTIRKILESIPLSSTLESDAEFENLHKLKSAYSSCLDTDHLDELGMEPIIPLVQAVFDKFGTLDSEPSEERSEGRHERITETLSFLHSRAIDALFRFEVAGDAGGDDPQIQSLWFYQTTGSLPSKEYYEEKPIMDLYHSVLTSILISVAEDISHRVDGSRSLHSFDQNNMSALTWRIIEFERQLSRAGAKPEILQDPTLLYNPYPLEKLQEALPFFSFSNYLSTLHPHLHPKTISVTHPPYLSAISRLVGETPDHVLAGYFVSRVVMTYVDLLGPDVEVRKQWRRLQEVLQGVKKGTEEDRVDLCLNHVNEVLGFMAGGEFIKEAFSPEAKKEGEDITNAIIQAFYRKLSDVTWMDKVSAEAAQNKAKVIIPKVGYPLVPDNTDAESLRQWYKGVNIDEDDYFGNVVKSRMGESSREWMNLGKQRDRRTWWMHPQDVNAYYSPPDGEIHFPAGIMQTPFYSKDWPSYLKYSAFGSVVGHELTHAFDTIGGRYDDKGRLRSWWTNATVDAFEERAQCLARQYSRYYIYDDEGRKVYLNGNFTISEDIADSGVAQAYAAWKYNETTPSQTLPGLNYTIDQLFFISYARIWAQVIRPSTAVQMIRSNEHSLRPFRVIGALTNLAAFHDAFKCPTGSRMNPPKKEQCLIWQ